MHLIPLILNLRQLVSLFEADIYSWILQHLLQIPNDHLLKLELYALSEIRSRPAMLNQLPPLLLVQHNLLETLILHVEGYHEVLRRSLRNLDQIFVFPVQMNLLVQNFAVGIHIRVSLAHIHRSERSFLGRRLRWRPSLLMVLLLLDDPGQIAPTRHLSSLHDFDMRRKIVSQDSHLWLLNARPNLHNPLRFEDVGVSAHLIEHLFLLLSLVDHVADIELRLLAL